MPKLRLNRAYRNRLLAHAHQFVNALPISPEETKDLEDARLRRDTVSAALIAGAKAAIAAHFPESDMDVLRRYNCVSKQSDARFVVLDNNELVFEVAFYDDASYYRGRDARTWEEDHDHRSRKEKEEYNARVDLPNSGRNSIMIPCDQALYDMAKDYKLAVREETQAEQRLNQKQSNLRHSLETLIGHAKTYEDVLAVWPPASEVREQLGLPSQALSVLSDDALAEIASASAMYQGLPAPTNQKSLPAPTSQDVIDVEPVEAAA